MTTEEKDLLLKDINARLPYGAKVEIADHNIDYMSWHFYPEDRFSSYDEYVTYLKEKGFALETPEGMYKTE